MTTDADGQSSRHTEEAINWAAGLIGGKVIRRERQQRWRPVYYLDIEKPDGTVKEVLLRGFRNPVGVDETAWRERLRMEAGVYEALMDTNCRVAAYHGYEPKGGWFLMDVLPGTPYVSRVSDRELQRSLYRQYIEALVELHQLDYRRLNLPDNLPVAATYEDGISLMLNEFRKPWDAYPESGKKAEPVAALAFWWLDNHRPKPVDRFSLTPGDIGTDQFMVDGGRLTGFFDLEMSYVGDPLQDIGCARYRDLGYPIPGLPEYLRYWGELMGRDLDKESLCYWTVAAMFAGLLYTYPLWRHPVAQLHRDCTFMHAIIPTNLRGTCEALAEYYGVDLEPPARPEPHVTSYTRYNSWVVDQLNYFYSPRTNDDGLLLDYRCSAALAETGVLCQTLGPMIEHQNISDLEKLLGKRFDDQDEALRAIHHRIATEPEVDLEETIRALYRIQCRNEFLVEPIQNFCGYGHANPLQRMF